MINARTITITVVECDVNNQFLVNSSYPDNLSLEGCSEKFKDTIKDLMLRIGEPLQWYKEFTDKNLQKLKESEGKVDNRSQVQ